MTIKAAGILFVTPDNQALYLKRGPGGDWPGAWCFPGGKVEDRETALQAAEREAVEEIGFLPEGTRALWSRRIAVDPVAIPGVPAPAAQADPAAETEAALAASQPEEVDFTTFLQRVPAKFEPKLDGEHVGYAWAPIDQPPEPLHPGCRIALARFGMDELGVARAIAAGDLTSPQKYGNVWLFDIRITGTGASYRPNRTEYVWRDKSLYLTDEFLARCNGLAVVWEHPDTKPALDSAEFNDRIIGTIFLPHIRGEDVWGVAKIYDAAAAEMMASERLSTSPGVVFSAASGNEELKLKDGSTLLIEGKPALLDHLAVVAAGVWDKGGPPTGVSSIEVHMAEETKAEERVDAAAVMDALKGIKDRLDSAHSRLDAFEASRKDADEEKRLQEEREKNERDEERARADRKARHDAARKDRFHARKDGESDEDMKARHDADEKAMCDDLVKAGEKEEEAKDAARRARHDAEESDKRSREDRARKDAEEQARKDAAAVASENTELRTRLAALEGRFKEVDPEERDALAAAQARFDSVAGLFGERVPAPIGGESSLSYRRRMLQRFLKHSPHFKESRLDSLDSAALGLVENQVLADAANAARHDAEAKPGILVPHVSHDDAGRRITRFHGDPIACWAPFMTAGQRGHIVRKPGL